MFPVHLDGVCKVYRARQQLSWRRLLRPHAPENLHAALQDVSIRLPQGSVLGIVGRNGAGKSTLLKIVAGTLAPTSGIVAVAQPVAAILELGSGFHPELSGWDNARLGLALLGLDAAASEQALSGIATFAQLGDAMARPIKTYSTGMVVRLAFAVTTCQSPEVLILDEALSVGDGAFARRSFERIMQFRRDGATILFSSHSLYHIEALADRVIWLDGGRIIADGAPQDVLRDYQQFLDHLPESQAPLQQQGSPVLGHAPPAQHRMPARLRQIRVNDQPAGQTIELTSTRDTLRIEVAFASDPALPAPGVGIIVTTTDGRAISSTSTIADGIVIDRDAQGCGTATLELPALPLLRGRYLLAIYLLSEDGLLVYEELPHAAELLVHSGGPELGYVLLPRRWLPGGTSEEALEPSSHVQTSS
jgi:lipopolysaccharide transport system ATP-binding protein